MIGLTFAQFLMAQSGKSEQPTSDPRNFDATIYGEHMPLGPSWLFAPGDNPAWSSPALDDSAWMTVSADKDLSDYGIHEIHYAWYRLHIHLRPETRNVAIGVIGVNGRYEVFANGVRIGGNGKMTGLQQFAQNALTTFPVPESQTSVQGSLLIAVRFALNAKSTLGSGTMTPFNSRSIYLLSQSSAPIISSFVYAHNAGPSLLACGFALIVCLISFALYNALPASKEYLAIGICLLSATLAAAVDAWLNVEVYTFPPFLAMFVVLGVENFALIEFVRLVLRLPRSRWLLALEVLSSLAFLFDATDILGVFPPSFYLLGFFLPVLIVKVILPVLLVKGWRHGNREALLLLPAVLLGSFADYWNALRTLAFSAHLNGLAPYLPFNLNVGSYQFNFYRLGDYAFYTTLLLFLILRTVRIAHERAQAAAELEAARTTQQLLLAHSSHPTPGFHVETVYHPAKEVGGYFFLVSSTPTGGLIAIIGDVSGKGLIAAMKVAMILGVLRRESSWEPAQILRNLNNALLDPEEPGFTTACCVLLHHDGRYILANAGHMMPYVDGAEVTTPPSLPLGLMPDQEYILVEGHLEPRQRLVLLSDGVLEARSTTGELLGFDRLGPLTRKAACEIADTAKAFGQDDDITVLTLACTA